MPNQKNKHIVKNLSEKIASAKSMIFADYKGLKSNQANELRAKLDEADAEVEITKNTLLKVALKEQGVDIKEVEKSFEGSLLTIFSLKDPVAPVKKLFEYIKTASIPTVKFGFLDGKFYTGAEMESLSKLPTREVLIAQVLSGLNSPITGFVNVLSGTKRNFVQVLNAVAEKKGSNG